MGISGEVAIERLKGSFFLTLTAKTLAATDLCTASLTCVELTASNLMVTKLLESVVENTNHLVSHTLVNVPKQILSLATSLIDHLLMSGNSWITIRIEITTAIMVLPTMTWTISYMNQYLFFLRIKVL